MSEGANKPITDLLMREFPKEALRHRQVGGGSALSYYPGHTIIHRLIDATDNRFDAAVTGLTFTDTLIYAVVRLTIPGLGIREHIGVQRWADKTQRGALASEDLIKGAVTDGLKKAATLFGVALDLYGEDYEGDDYQALAPAQPSQPRLTSRPKPAPQPAPDPRMTELGKARADQVKAMIEDYPDWDMARTTKFLRGLGMSRWSTVTDEMLDQLQERMDSMAADDEVVDMGPRPAAPAPDNLILQINAITDSAELAKLSARVVKEIRDANDPIRIRLKQRFNELKGAA